MADRRLLREGMGAGTWALLACAVWSVGLLVAALLGMGSRIGEPPPAPAAALPAQAKPAPERIGPYAQYREAELRPLFASDRRPREFVVAGASGPETASAAPAPTLELQLTGVLISPRVSLATVQAPGGQPQRIRLGQSPEGNSSWTLASLSPRSAVFDGPGGRKTLQLVVNGSATSPAINMPPPPPPPPPASPPPGGDDAEDAASAAAMAAADAAAAAADAAMSESQKAQVQAIRQRIEARRAQVQQSSGAPPAPPKPTP